MKNLQKLSIMIFLTMFNLNIWNALNTVNTDSKIQTNMASDKYIKANNIFQAIFKKIQNLTEKEQIIMLNKISIFLQNKLENEIDTNEKEIFNNLNNLIIYKITYIKNNIELKKEKDREKYLKLFKEKISTFSDEKKQNLLIKINYMLESDPLDEDSRIQLKAYKEALWISEKEKTTNSRFPIDIEEINKSLKISESSSNYKSSSNSSSSSSSSSQSGIGKIICTELARQWYIKPEVRIWDEVFAELNITRSTIAVYHFWAQPIVSLMKKSKILTNIIAPYWMWWANIWLTKLDFLQKIIG